ncbi:HipA domain-containing protein [Lacibacter sediminis]|uniref:HipA domain-containing protein n=1 Tax=Lacibacter sediminis TaxID=2760713 RepID=A0A7G5XFU3_9BACT|nr:HipA domain-containing protein [Lacibacter sediminis]QNA44346.1 HipA domain-containing protein [Lacibacter sediminis]
MRRCLFCYLPLESDEIDFHSACSKKMFGQAIPPELPYSAEQMQELGKEVIKSQMTVTGVQPKLSLDIANTKTKKEPKRFSIVGLWGGYILKPPTANYPQLPEVEDLTMHLATVAKIEVVPHSLIRLKSGELAYITRRIDRLKDRKLHMEDMCQLMERLTEDKYRGSYEQIAKAIEKYSVNPGLDIVIFFEQVLFSFLTGNADMHLKNFSLIRKVGKGYTLSPAYDMVATAIVNPADDEELALNLNGKKRKIKRSDFVAAFTNSGLESKQQQNIFNKMLNVKDTWLDFIESSFLSDDFKIAYKRLIEDRFVRLLTAK